LAWVKLSVEKGNICFLRRFLGSFVFQEQEVDEGLPQTVRGSEELEAGTFIEEGGTEAPNGELFLRNTMIVFVSYLSTMGRA